MFPEVIVTGVGRTGTTNTARILHNHFGICMGHNFTPAYEPLPDGGYEELSMLKWSHQLVEKPEANVDDWTAQYAMVHPDCDHHGIKQTVLSLATYEQIALIGPKLLVTTSRPEEPTVRSLMKWRGYDKARATEFYLERAKNLLSILEGWFCDGEGFDIVNIDYTNQRSDEDIIATLKPVIDEIYGGI
jgi:hypothetical protein